MPVSAFKIRSAMGAVNVARGQFEAIFSGTIKDTPEARQEALETLQRAASLLQEEAVLVESGRTPTIRDWDDKGVVVFDGSVPYSHLPTIEEQVVTKGAVEALAGMVQ